MGCLLFVVLIAFLLVWPSKGSQQTPPHIVFIYADDLGWNDVSFHGSAEIPTPNIDALAMSGILLNNYYGLLICTPSRAALLTGKYPIRLGLQHFVLRDGEASGLPLTETALPQHLKKLGYENHMVGKWHLGYMTKNYTPTYRGFDSHFGYWNGYIDYYNHVKFSVPKENMEFLGLDLHDGVDTVKNYTTQYATELFTRKAEDIIKNHDTSKPLFLYFAHLAVHVANRFMKFQAPPKYVDRVKHISNIERRIFAGVVSAMDDSVGCIFKALHEKNMLDNTIIAFVSDNGADVEKGVGSNFPLRGYKYTLWEGGNRLPALIWSPLFNLKEPRISMQMMHVTDWLPTFYSAAGGNINDLKNIDGIDMWAALTKNLPSPRKEFLYNIDPITSSSAFRMGDMKVINGANGGNSWYNPTERNCLETKSSSSKSNVCDFDEQNVIQRILNQTGRWILKEPEQWRKEAAVFCQEKELEDLLEECYPSIKPCLFNITGDPCERNNLALKYPDVVDKLLKRIDDYKRTAVPPQSKPPDPKANPLCHDFSYVPWLDQEYYNECTEYS